MVDSTDKLTCIRLQMLHLSDRSKSKLPIQKERPGSLCVLLELVTDWLYWRAGNVPENDRVEKERVR